MHQDNHVTWNQIWKRASVSLINHLEKQSKPFWVVTAILIMGLVGFLDHLTGYEISFSLFYLAPISMVTWFAGGYIGILVAVLSAVTWLLADITSQHFYSSNAIYFWNSAIRLGFFLIVALLLSALKTAFAREQALAETDSLTGAANMRSFFNAAETELYRAERYKHPFTAVYIDVDNFKALNDELGHITGDRVLRRITHTIRKTLRKTDIIGRLGGDEFALLLPETGKDQAQNVIIKIYDTLNAEMKKNNWPATFSIGAVTYLRSPSTVAEMIRKIDTLMYSVKRKGKNDIRHMVHDGR